MTRTLLRLLVFLLLASAEATVARRLTGFVLVPFLLPVVLASALRVPAREALFIALLAGAAREPWSGAPPFAVTAGMVAPSAVILVARSLQPQFAIIGVATIGCVAAVATSVWLHLLTGASGVLSDPRLLTLRVVAPSVIATVLALVVRSVRPLWNQGRLSLLRARSQELGVFTQAPAARTARAVKTIGR